jgi:hypothetical protein
MVHDLLGGQGEELRHIPATQHPHPPKESLMPKMRKKSDLPTKICAVCGLPFAWRKKWQRDWENVTHCSDRCRAAGKSGQAKAST